MTAQIKDKLKIRHRYFPVTYLDHDEIDDEKKLKEKFVFIKPFRYSHFNFVSAHPPLPEKLLYIYEDKNYNIVSTGNWRGYLGYWEIKKDGKLYLIKLTGGLKLKTKNPIFADWITGTLTISQGSSYLNKNLEESIVIKVKEGICQSVYLIETPKKVVTYSAEELVDFLGLENDEII